MHAVILPRYTYAQAGETSADTDEKQPGYYMSRSDVTKKSRVREQGGLQLTTTPLNLDLLAGPHTSINYTARQPIKVHI